MLQTSLSEHRIFLLTIYCSSTENVTWKERCSVLFCLFFEKEGVLFVFNFTGIPSGLPSKLLDSWALKSGLSQSQSTSNASSPLVLLTVHINMPACFLCWLYLSFMQASFSEYPAGTGSSVFHGLIRERHLMAASAHKYSATLIHVPWSAMPERLVSWFHPIIT